MKKSTTIAVIIVILVVIIIVWIIAASGKQASPSNLSSNSNPAVADNNANPTVNNNTTPTPQLFSDSPLSQNAYLISTPTYDANTKTALSGFDVTKKTLTDGSVQYTLNSTNPEYQTQTYTVKKGEKLYFIENLLTDDNGNTDKSMRDDTAVLVDANGYIVNQ